MRYAVPSITTTLPQFGQFLTGNRFAEGKTTKASSMWAGRYEEVLKVLFLRSVVVILAGLCAPALWTAIGTGYDAAKEKVQESQLTQVRGNTEAAFGNTAKKFGNCMPDSQMVKYMGT